MTNTKFSEIIKLLGRNEIILSFEELKMAWEQCKDMSKMLDVANCLDIDKTLFVQIACKCARLVLHLVPEGEDRPRLAIEAAEAWVETPSKENGNAARAAANATTYAATYIANIAANAAAYAAADAAYAAFYVAAHATANATHAAANAAHTAANAVYYTTGADINTKQKCAEIVREYVPFEILKLAIIFS